MRIDSWSIGAAIVVPWWVLALVLVGIAASAAGLWWVLRRATRRP